MSAPTTIPPALRSRLPFTRATQLAGALLLALIAGGCASDGDGAAATRPPYVDADFVAAQVRRDVAAVTARLRDPAASVRWDAVRTLGRIGGDEAAVAVAPLMADPDAAVREAAAFAVGASGSSRAPALLEVHWPTTDAADTTSFAGAAAMGLGYCKAPEAEGLLVAIASRTDAPPEAPAALFDYWRWSGNKAPATLPTGKLLAYARHASADGRAGIGWIGRAVKDPALLDALVSLSRDAEWTVRRAVALGLGDGRRDDKEPENDTRRSVLDARRARAALLRLLADPEPKVVISAVRALGTYHQPVDEPAIVELLDSKDFNVRATVAQVLATFTPPPDPEAEAPAAPPPLPGYVEKLVAMARDDPSTSVRYECATALAAVAPDHGAALIVSLGVSELEYDRVATVNLLAKAPGQAATDNLIRLAGYDTHVRVRESALEALAGRAGDDVTEAVRRGLADSDPVIVAIACGEIVDDKREDLYESLFAVPARFPGAAGADAREGAITAIGKLKRAGDRGWLSGFVEDPSPSVRWAAVQALAGMSDGADKPDERSESYRLVKGDLDPASSAILPRLTEHTRLVIETDAGTFTVALAVDEAPVHCAHVASLAAAGFYDGLDWHRVVPDFVIQGGCPRGDGSGNAGLSLPLEPTRIPFDRGALGMPRSGHPDSGGCQLFVCHSRAPHLDLYYTAFGWVTDGMDVIDRVDVDSKIVRVTVEGLR